MVVGRVEGVLQLVTAHQLTARGVVVQTADHAVHCEEEERNKNVGGWVSVSVSYIIPFLIHSTVALSAHQHLKESTE